MSGQQQQSNKTQNQFTFEKPVEQGPNKSQGTNSGNFGQEIRTIGSGVVEQTAGMVVGTIPDMLRSVLGQPILQVDMDPAKKNQEAQMWKQRYQMKEMQRRQETEYLIMSQEKQRQRVDQLRSELQMLTSTVSKFAHEAEMAVFNAPASPSIYHEHFFTKLMSFLKNLRKRINTSANWMAAHNARASKKKGLWGVAQNQKGQLKVDVYSSNERSMSFGG